MVQGIYIATSSVKTICTICNARVPLDLEYVGFVLFKKLARNFYLIFLLLFTVCSRSIIRLLPRLIHRFSALPQNNEDGRIAKDENDEGDDGRQDQVRPDLVVVGVRDVASPVGLVGFDVGLVVMLNEQKYKEMVRKKTLER